VHGTAPVGREDAALEYRRRPEAAYRVLGGLRFSLAMMVVVGHTFALSFGAGPPRYFIAQIGLGNIAVNGFFVLSGFIIAEAVHLFYTGRPGAFLVNRALRLIPPFWAATLVSILVHVWLSRLGALKLPDYESVPSNMFAPDNLLVQITAIIPIFNLNRVLGDAREAYYFVRFAWAVYVEFVFYFAYAAAMLCWNWARRAVPLRTFALAWGGGFLALHAVNEYVHPLYWALHYAPYFVLGCSLYFVRVSGDRAAKLLSLIAYILVGLHFFRYTQGQTAMSVEAVYGIAKPRVLVATLMMLSLPLVLMALASLQVSRRAARIDKWLGDLTYPLYLNHYVVLVAAWSLVEQHSWAVQIVVIGLALLLSYAMKLAVDVPVASLRDWVRGLRLLDAKTA
jgi:peptidoglycan/LPS O-acetylase OafA/YrhL